ncbi:hypothetical protein E2562_022705 [Oryza meyeriana var. granulata]|uniref:Uncharacterized protein n=1 Tax=Oryza meyeriana var. granulata TaxID=110450 RepID=A0A6G1E015_9ORYZ|nr:hypothetical protein E2562_022705 [Oryza meyeriana var. granulata]
MRSAAWLSRMLPRAADLSRGTLELTRRAVAPRRGGMLADLGCCTAPRGRGFPPDLRLRAAAPPMLWPADAGQESISLLFLANLSCPLRGEHGIKVHLLIALFQLSTGTKLSEMYSLQTN